MKIGILSLQRIDNFGSLLQAYGLKKTLESFGNDVAFIDIKENKSDNELLEGYQLDFSYEGGGGNRFSVSKVNRYLLNRILHKIMWNKQRKIFDVFRENKLNINHSHEHFDLCVLGSDEVFSCLNAGWWGFSSQLFGNIPETNKIITYAASCGATTYEKLPQKVRAKIHDTFKKVSAFSVRDDNTKEFVAALTKKEISVNLDPVLIYNFDKEIEEVSLPKVPERYCLIYAYSNRIVEKKEYASILTFCRDNNLIPVTLFGAQFWCNNHIICSPFECLKLFQNADFVITDTYHGTIFSIKYAKRFGVIQRDSNKNKLGDLIKRLDISEHVIEDIEELERVYMLEKDRGSIKVLLENERKRTMDYLKTYAK